MLFSWQGLAELSFFGNGKKSLDELSSFLSSPFSGWILTSLDLGTRSSESWYDSSSAHSDHRLWAGYLLLVYDSCFEKNRTKVINSKKRGWDKGPSLSIVLDRRARRGGWVGSTTLISSALQPYSTVREGGTTKSNSDELPISVPLSFLSKYDRINSLDGRICMNLFRKKGLGQVHPGPKSPFTIVGFDYFRNWCHGGDGDLHDYGNCSRI